ncbi:MAG: M1 family metallopeptidase, partial [Candidatus Kapaibacteriota bacterium]
MRKILFVFALVIINILQAFSITIFNDPPEQIIFPTPTKNFSSEAVLGLTKKPYDVLEYDLFLDWYNVMKNPSSMDSIDRVWWGRNIIALKSLEPNLELIELDAVELFIDSVFVEIHNQKTKVFPTPKISNGKLRVSLPTKLNLDEVCKVTIYYTYARNIPESNYRGFFLYPKGKFVGRLPAPFYDSVFVEERIAYTMSEPEDARYWLPCNDAPYDKADAKITVRVPKDYLVASNGYLSEVATDGDTAKIFFWVSDKPLTTYLIAVTASKYVMFDDWYRKVTSPQDSVEIKYFVWEKDYKATKTDGSEYNAKNTLQTTPKMMEFFSKIFVEYPFIKYGIVALMPFHFGGMEHQTITSINRVWLRQNVQFGLAHELAHQWIGDLVTCATWNDIWFNEGGATWSEALYAENLWGKSGYDYFILSARREYLRKGGIELPAIYGLPTNTIFGDYAVLVYQKSSWVFHMLKENLGDSLFFRIFRKFLVDYAYKSITTGELINYFK